MQNVLKISDAASLALHTMCVLAKSARNDQYSNHEIATILDVSEAHLSKVLQRLVKAGFIYSMRGPSGGFKLAKLPDEISLLQIYEAIDGSVGPSACLLGKPACDGNCVLGELLHKVNKDVRDYLAAQKLSKISVAFPHNTKGNKNVKTTDS